MSEEYVVPALAKFELKADERLASSVNSQRPASPEVPYPNWPPRPPYWYEELRAEFSSESPLSCMLLEMERKQAASASALFSMEGVICAGAGARPAAKPVTIGPSKTRPAQEPIKPAAEAIVVKCML